MNWFATYNYLKRGWLALSIGLVMVVQTVATQAGNLSDRQVFTAYMEKTLQAARAQYYRQPTNAEAARRFGSACFDRGEFTTNDTERATLAVEAINAMRQ